MLDITTKDVNKLKAINRYLSNEAGSDYENLEFITDLLLKVIQYIKNKDFE